MKLESLADGVFACLQPDRGLGYSNSGLVDRGGGLVVDTFWDLAHTRDLIAAYARVWRGQPGRVVNTHSNGDHCWGNQLFADAEIIGHRLCAEGFGKESPAMLQAVRRAASSSDAALASLGRKLADWDFSGIELRPPNRLIEDRLTLHLDDVTVELLYVGPAHTAGDVIVHLPRQRIVFTGDALFRRCTPIGWEGTYANWFAALDRIVALEPSVIVPGHGPLCGVEGPKKMKAYLEYVRAESQRFFEQGLSALEAAKRIDLGPYAGWTEPARLVFNVARAYRELRGEPFDAPIDAVALFREMYELEQARG
jgi:glyoxylase-like metal-dependent hydrolase (beta-lactamase superfamily II)